MPTSRSGCDWMGRACKISSKTPGGTWQLSRRLGPAPSRACNFCQSCLFLKDGYIVFPVRLTPQYISFIPFGVQARVRGYEKFKVQS